MPVVIKDFEVLGQENAPQPPAETASTEQPARQPLSARQVAKMLKFEKQRASRLHAD